MAVTTCDQHALTNFSTARTLPGCGTYGGSGGRIINWLAAAENHLSNWRRAGRPGYAARKDAG